MGSKYFFSLLRYLVRKTRAKWTVKSAKLPPILVWFLFQDSAMRAERQGDHPPVMRRVFCIIKYKLTTHSNLGVTVMMLSEHVNPSLSS